MKRFMSALGQNKWEAFIVFLLGVIIAMLSYYLVRQSEILDEEVKLTSTLQSRQNQITRVLIENPHTSPPDREEFCHWIWETRGSKITYYEYYN